MDSFEKMIHDQRGEIQSDTPQEGHFERFEMKLSKGTRTRSNYWIGFLSGVAAVFVLGLFVFFNSRKAEEKPMSLANVSEQYAEVEMYYTNSIQLQTRKLNEYTNVYGKDDPSLKMILKEMEEYDRVYVQISNDLRTTPNDERVIHAMVTYYQTKLEIINRILKEIESKQVKVKKDENTSI